MRGPPGQSGFAIIAPVPTISREGFPQQIAANRSKGFGSVHARCTSGRGADTPTTDEGMQLNSEPTRYDDGPQPVADLGRPANGIHNLARDPIPPDQVATGRLRAQGAV